MVVDPLPGCHSSPGHRSGPSARPSEGADTAGADGKPGFEPRTGRRVVHLGRLEASSKTRRMGALSQQGCQQTRTCQRRNWRVRAVERGQRSEPAWLRAHPGLHYFEPEKPPCTQIPRNVWDTETAGTGDGVNYNSERNLAIRKLAPRRGFEPQFTAPKAAVLPLDDRGMVSRRGSYSSVPVCSPSPQRPLVLVFHPAFSLLSSPYRYNDKRKAIRTGVWGGLQNRSAAVEAAGVFDSHCLPPSPRELSLSPVPICTPPHVTFHPRFNSRPLCPPFSIIVRMFKLCFDGAPFGFIRTFGRSRPAIPLS